MTSAGANADSISVLSGYNSSLKKPLVFEGNYIARHRTKEVRRKSRSRGRDEEIQLGSPDTAKIRGESPFKSTRLP